MARSDEYAHYVVGLLARFSRLAALYPGVVANFELGHADLTWLPPPPDLAARMVHPIEATRRWLDPEEDLDDERLLLALSVALRALDDYFASMPTRYEVTDMGVLVVGARTWGLADAAGGAARPGVGGPVGSRWPFPHMRWTALHDSELYPFESAPACTFSRALESGTVTIGVCTLPGSHTLFEATRQLSPRYHGIRATAVRARDGGPPEAEVVACVDWARARGVHVLAFPELAVGPAQLEALRREISRDPGALELVVPGSFHVPASDHRRYLHPSAPGHINRAPLWVVADGELIEWSHYDKTIPCAIDADPDALDADPDMRAIAQAARAAGCGVMIEDIRSSGSIRVLPTGLGVFGFAIGHDAAGACGIDGTTERYAAFADFLVVVSRDRGDGGLAELAGAAPARWQACATVTVNAAGGRAAPADAPIELASGVWPAPDAAAGVAGCAYYRGVPPAYGPRTVARRALPADGNAVFDIAIPRGRELTPRRGIAWMS